VFKKIRAPRFFFWDLIIYLRDRVREGAQAGGGAEGEREKTPR